MSTDIRAELNNFLSANIRFKIQLQKAREAGNSITSVNENTKLVELPALELLYIDFDTINRTHKYRGKLGYCYRDAYRLSSSAPNFIYCEGYAVARQDVPIPLMHAWCVDLLTKEVYDPCWNKVRKKMGFAYIGIPLSTLFLCRAMLASKTYGVLDSLWCLKDLQQYSIKEAIHPEFIPIVLKQVEDNLKAF